MGANFRPHLKVEVDNALPAVAHPTYTRLYDGTEPTSRHALYMPSDGSLIRARLERREEKLYLQRVVNPGASSSYSGWTYMNKASKEANICLCGHGAQVLLIYVKDTNDREILYRESTNYGADWSEERRIVFPVVDSVLWVAAGVSPLGIVALFYGGSNHVVYAMRKLGSTWQSPTYWPHYDSIRNIKGISCAYGTDWNLVVCGEGPGGEAKVWTLVYGNGTEVSGGAWSPPMELTMAESNSNVSFLDPCLAKVDTFRIFFTEKYTGSGPYSRAFWSYTPSGDSFLTAQWREPVPFNRSPSYGLSLAGDSKNLWLSTASELWRGGLAQTLDLTEDVLEADVVESFSGGGATLLLRNDDGRYNSAGAGSTSPLRKGARVRISPGYVTSLGAETSLGPSFWVGGLELRSGGGSAQLALHLQDGWSLLEQWRARQQHSWDLGAAPVEDIVAFILARVGLEISVINSSDTFKYHRPSFTIHPNSSAAAAVTRLIKTVPDTLFLRSGVPNLKLLSAGDTVDYSYGTDHPITRGSYLVQSSRYNRIQAYGDGVLHETIDWEQLGQVTDRLLQVYDLNLDTVSKAQERGESLLALEASSVSVGSIEAPLNCGLELYDLVDVTDPGAGLAAAKRRVVGLRLRYSRGPGRRPAYSHTLTLAGV